MHWLTSFAWSQLTVSEKVLVLKAWYDQNELESYKRISLQDLPKPDRHELKRIGFHRILNHFKKESGPNCFAAVAGAIAQQSGLEITRLWLHDGPFLRFIADGGYKKIKGTVLIKKDILVFVKSHKAVHAAYCLSVKHYFEKPGQDFYETYRIEKLQNWKKCWPSTEMQIWRRSKIKNQ